jgi:hypothetical protein
MLACKIIGGIFTLVGLIIAIAGAAQSEPWSAGGAGLALLGRVVSEKFPDWFNLY